MIPTGLLRSLLTYRGFILGSVKREFQLKYRNSLLGAAWTVLNPLAQILVYTLIFAQVMRVRLPGVDTAFGYGIYLCAGIFTWGLFAEILGRCQNMFLDNGNLIKKLSFPRIALPAIVILSALLNFCLVFSLFAGFLVLDSSFPGWVFLAVIPVLLVEIVFALGLGMIIGVLNVFFRDIGQFFGIALQFWFWLTPIVFPLNVLPDSVRTFVSWNPLTPVITASQGILVSGQTPHWASLAWPLLLGLAFCLLGLRLFRRHAGEMVDEL
jgi:lipopolysaccharide transport system permease protein